MSWDDYDDYDDEDDWHEPIKLPSPSDVERLTTRPSIPGWNLGPQFQHGPPTPGEGAQGSLFSGGGAARDYRHQGLWDAMQKVSVSPSTNDYWDADVPWDHSHPTDPQMAGIARMEKALSGKIAEHLLNNTTVPPEHLEGLKAIQFGASTRKNDAAGEYHAKEGRIDLEGGMDWIDTGTMTHEIGHHVSHTAGQPHARYGTQQEQGREEAFADHYAMVHAKRTGPTDYQQMADEVVSENIGLWKDGGNMYDPEWGDAYLHGREPGTIDSPNLRWLSKAQGAPEWLQTQDLFGPTEKLEEIRDSLKNE